MILLELRTCVDTDNHAVFTITKLGGGLIAENRHFGDIIRYYKDSEIWMAYPIEVNHCAVKRWLVILK
jgi:hypothetical protein